MKRYYQRKRKAPLIQMPDGNIYCNVMYDIWAGALELRVFPKMVRADTDLELNKGAFVYVYLGSLGDALTSPELPSNVIEVKS